jgi:hypothetical protein
MDTSGGLRQGWPIPNSRGEKGEAEEEKEDIDKKKTEIKYIYCPYHHRRYCDFKRLSSSWNTLYDTYVYILYFNINSQWNTMFRQSKRKPRNVCEVSHPL